MKTVIIKFLIVNFEEFCYSVKFCSFLFKFPVYLVNSRHLSANIPQEMTSKNLTRLLIR